MGKQAPPPVGERMKYMKTATPGVTPDREVKRQTHTLLVVGPKRVLGASKGEVFEAELTDKELASLIEAGHVIPAPKEPKKGAGTQDSPADKESE